VNQKEMRGEKMSKNILKIMKELGQALFKPSQNIKQK